MIMKKIVIVLAVLVAAVFAGVPVVNGIIMEKTLKSMVENINGMYDQTGSDLRIDVEEYNRGLADTRVRWRIDLGSLAGVYGVPEIVLTEHARHGYLGISSEISLRENGWYADWIKRLPGGRDPLKIAARYAVAGPIEAEIALDALPVQAPDAVLKIGGGTIHVSLDRELTAVSTQGRWEGITQDDDNQMGPVDFEAAHTRVTDLVWQGKGTFSVETFKGTEDDGTSMALSGLSAAYDLSADTDHRKMNMGAEITAEGIEFNGRSLSGWALEWGLDNVDIRAYEDLMKIYYQILNAQMARITDPALTPDQAGEMMQKTMARNAPMLIAGLEKLLKKDLTIRLPRLDITLPQGKIDGSFRLGLTQDVTMAQGLALAARPALALEMISLKSELSLPRELAGDRQDLTMPAFPGMKTGLFVDEGARLTHRAETRENRLYLNGQEVVLE